MLSLPDDAADRLSIFVAGQVLGLSVLGTTLAALAEVGPFGSAAFLDAGEPFLAAARWLLSAVALAAIVVPAGLLVVLPRWHDDADHSVARRALRGVALAGPLVLGLSVVTRRVVSGPIAQFSGGFTVEPVDAVVTLSLFVLVPAVGVGVEGWRSGRDGRQPRYSVAYAVSAVSATVLILAVAAAGSVLPGEWTDPLWGNGYPSRFPYVSSPGDAAATALFLLAAPLFATALIRALQRRASRALDGRSTTVFAVAAAATSLSLAFSVQLADPIVGVLPGTSTTFRHAPVDALVAGLTVTAAAAVRPVAAHRHNQYYAAVTDADSRMPDGRWTTVATVAVAGTVVTALVTALSLLAGPPEQTVAGYNAYWGLYEVVSVALVAVVSGGVGVIGVRSIRWAHDGAVERSARDDAAPDFGGWIAALAVTGVASIGVALGLALFASALGHLAVVPHVTVERLRVGPAAAAVALVLGISVAGRLTVRSWSSDGSDRRPSPGPAARRLIAVLVALAAVGAFLGASGLAHGLVAQEQLEPSDADFAFDYDPVNGTHGRLTVTHDGGDAVFSRALFVRGSGLAAVSGANQTRAGRWQGTTTSVYGHVEFVTPSDHSLGDADSVTLGVRSTCEVWVVAEYGDGRTRTLGEFDCPGHRSARTGSGPASSASRVERENPFEDIFRRAHERPSERHSP